MALDYGVSETETSDEASDGYTNPPLYYGSSALLQAQIPPVSITNFDSHLLLAGVVIAALTLAVLLFRD